MSHLTSQSSAIARGQNPHDEQTASSPSAASHSGQGVFHSGHPFQSSVIGGEAPFEDLSNNGLSFDISQGGVFQVPQQAISSSPGFPSFLPSVGLSTAPQLHIFASNPTHLHADTPITSQPINRLPLQSLPPQPPLFQQSTRGTFPTGSIVDRNPITRFHEPVSSTAIDRRDQKKRTAQDPQFTRVFSGWSERSVKIRLPAEYQTYKSEDDAPEFEVPGVYIRNLLDLIRNAFQDPTALTFHMTPYQHFWKPYETAEARRIYSELYSSDAMLNEYNKIHSAPREPGCSLEMTVAAIMLWSDSTHLSSFGNASLWPIYVYFGNQSKYTRAKPTAFACHHLAYIPSLPDSFEDFYTSIFNGSPTPEVRTHCRRELMHAVWALLLDPGFMHAYEHGIVVRCADEVTRRLYPRFFTYSADYPEKVILATIKRLSLCPCPRCLTQIHQISDMGSKNDRYRRKNIRIDSQRRQADIEMTRSWIFERGYPVNGSQVAAVLGSTSAVPIRNAFSHQLLPFAFNFFSMFVPDLLHEFELGVWKHVFTHLVRILYAIGGDAVQRLNKRYRQSPTFGRDTIRRFNTSMSEMKKLAGWDFEDLLQCALPAFEGLFPIPHDAIVSDLLFLLATWHASAKLRLHTDITLKHLEDTTTLLGRALRKFVKITCHAFVTRELPRELAARSRRRAAAKAKTGKAPAGANASARNAKKKTTSNGHKLFNLSTYKLHALADYASTIRVFGTTDSYSTQVAELEHRRVKRFFARTNKVRFTCQITRHERRERILQRISLRQAADDNKTPGATGEPSKHSPVSKPVNLDFKDSDPLPYTDPAKHYHISHSTRYYENITKWLGDNKEDPAVQNFLPRLKDHILARLFDIPYDGDEHDFSDFDRNTITFVNNRIYKHKVIRINYTTYDVRRAQDSLNPRVHADFMCLSHKDQHDDDLHPYWYGRIIGIFHALIRHVGPRSKSTEIQKVDFLWVRWFGRDPDSQGGWAKRRLHRVGFLDSGDDAAFGFLNPMEIIRAVHLIPAFVHGKTSEIMGPSIARQSSEDHEDWSYFYVNPFVDRDMFMRFLGGGVGHKGNPNRLRAEDTYGFSETLADEDNDVGFVDEVEVGVSGDDDDDDDDDTEDSDSLDENTTGNRADSENDENNDSSFFDPEDGDGEGEDLVVLEGYGAL